MEGPPVLKDIAPALILSMALVAGLALGLRALEQSGALPDFEEGE